MANHKPQTNPNSLANLRPNPNPKWVKGAKEPREASKKGNAVIKSNLIIAEALKEYFIQHPDAYAKYNEVIVEKAMNGDTRAWEIVRDTIGQKPKDSIDIASDNKIEFIVGDLKEYAD